QLRYYKLAWVNRRRSKVSGKSTSREPAEGFYGRLNRALFSRPADFARRTSILFRIDVSEFRLQPAQLRLFIGSAEAHLLLDLRRSRLQSAKLRDLRCRHRRLAGNSV